MRSNFKDFRSFAEEVTRIEQAKQDLLAPMARVAMLEPSKLQVGDTSFGLTNNGHRQLAEKVGVPWDYYEKAATVPGLREYNVNAWARAQQNDKRLFRVLDGNVRAVLSSRFKPLDNFALLDAVVPALRDVGTDGMLMRTYALTESHLYLQVGFPTTETPVVQPDRHEALAKPIRLMAGLTIRNSEVGKSKFLIALTVWNLACWNGLITENVLQQYHLGGELNGDDAANGSIWRDDTLAKELELIRLKARDIVRDAMDPARMLPVVDKARVALGDEVKVETEQLVTNVTKRFGLTQGEAKGAVENMMLEGRGNLTRWGLVNGINALVHKMEDTDRQYEMERTAAALLEFKPNEWAMIAN